MRELKAEWETPRAYVAGNPGRGSWTLCDTSSANAPWAWITYEQFQHGGKFRLELWAGHMWEEHGVFDTLEVAQSVGRIMARIMLERLGS